MVVLAHGTGGEGMMGCDWGGMMEGFWGIGGILVTVFWVLILIFLGLGIVWLWRRIKEDDPLIALKRRYAQGEITAAEFEKMKKKLLT